MKKTLLIPIILSIILIGTLFGLFIFNNINNNKNHNNTNIVNNEIIYTNDDYEFSLALPNSWQNYSILSEKWSGLDLNGIEQESGDIVHIRHPQWSESNPRQDIPVMIFSETQWNKLQKEEFHIGAAPINPKLLARNKNYFFALPARYNFGFLEGYEEVENILNNNSVSDKNWMPIQKEVLNCNIKEVMGLHSNFVSIKLKNKSKIEGYQPENEDIMAILKSANCKNKITVIIE